MRLRKSTCLLFIAVIVILLFLGIGHGSIGEVHAQDFPIDDGELLTGNSQLPPEETGQGSGKSASPAERVITNNMVQIFPFDLSNDEPVNIIPDTIYPYDPSWITVMREGFEDEFPPAGWYVFDNNGLTNGEVYWGKVKSNSYDSIYSEGMYSVWAAGGGANGRDPAVSNYPKNMDSWMVFGPFDLSTVDNAMLEFNLDIKTQPNHDFLFWGASIDGSSFYGEAISGEAAYCAKMHFSSIYGLGNVVGKKKVWFAFNFSSDASISDRGPFLDEVFLKVYYQEPGPFYKLAPANNAINQPGKLSLSWSTSKDATSYEYLLKEESWGATFDFISTGNNTSVYLTELKPSTTYLWNVQAVNDYWITWSDDDGGGSWRRFTTGPEAAAFSKNGPGDHAVDQPASLTLSWEPSANAYKYEYCVDNVEDGKCNAQWKSTSTDTFATITGVEAESTYFWQVRACSTYACKKADDDVWWSFTTGKKPVAFQKLAPANGETDQLLDPILNWETSTGAASYVYCLDTTNDSVCNTRWVSTGVENTVQLAGLERGKTYYWKVKAKNTYGNTAADSGEWWSFTTDDFKPEMFTKTNPSNGAVDQPLELTMSWGESVGAVSYDYCIDVTSGTVCDTGWISTGAETFVNLTGLKPGTTYYWTVRAKNVYGKTKSDEKAWWTFKTDDMKPEPFSKIGPEDAAMSQPYEFTLNWEVSVDAASYDYCIDKTSGTECDTGWISTGTETFVNLTGLKPATTYYWTVRARNAYGKTKSDDKAWWSFTTIN